MKIKSDLLKKLSRIIESAATPGATLSAPTDEKPNDIFEQVRPLLMKMGLNNMIDRTKTQIVEGQAQGSNSLYSLTLRRNAQITKNEIERIKRNEDYLNVIQWSAKAIEVQVWWPYKTPAERATPTRPGIPTVPPGAPPAPPK